MTWLTPWLGGIAAAITLGGCAYNSSRFHTGLPLAEFHAAVATTLPKGTPRQALLDTCKNEHLEVRRLPATKDQVPLEAVIYPQGVYSTFLAPPHQSGFLEFQFGSDRHLSRIEYRPPASQSASPRVPHEIQWREAHQ